MLELNLLTSIFLFAIYENALVHVYIKDRATQKTKMTKNHKNIQKTSQNFPKLFIPQSPDKQTIR